jgi:hypothetical protein
MSRRMRDALVGVAITLVALAGVLWQAGQSGAFGEDTSAADVPRLVCPLH